MGSHAIFSNSSSGHLASSNSSLAVAIAYPDLVSLTGIISNQVGQELETIFLLMMVYLMFSITISLFMNWYNKRMALVER